MDFNQAVLLGTIIASFVAALFGHRFIGPDGKAAHMPANVAIAGGALADTLGLRANTDAILRLAETQEVRGRVEGEAVKAMKHQTETFEKMLDEMREMRRAIEDAAQILARK